MKTKKRMLSLILALIMVFGLFAALTLTAQAAVNDKITVNGITYRVLSESGNTGTVQVGYGDDNNPYDTAVPTNRQGALAIPSTVTYGGKTYTVTGIGIFAFQLCENLTNVTIPNTVTSIGVMAFHTCKGLTSITIPSGVKSIDRAAFMYCRKAASVTIPNSVISIGDMAFYACESLPSVTIPSSVTSIDANAFQNCTALTAVTFNGNAPSAGSNVFNNTASGAVAYVYRAATGFPAQGQLWNGLIVKHIDLAIEYTVTFLDWNGAVLKTQVVESGKAATAPANPTRTGYTFIGWDRAFNNITGSLIVTAQYTINNYTVRFVDWNGTELKTQTVNYGTAATAPANPTRTGYIFTGWDRAFNNVTANLSVTAQYTCAHDVTYNDITLAPTCEETGLKDIYCAECKVLLEGGVVIAALGHDWDEWVVTTKATCVTEGEETRKCKRDDYDAFETQPIDIDPDNHAGGIYKDVINAPTCTADGVMGTYCEDCKALLNTEAIPVLGHDMAYDSHDAGGVTFKCQRGCCDYYTEFEAYDFRTAVSSSTNLQNSSTVTITVTGTLNGEEYRIAAQSVKLKQNGTQTVTIGGVDVTVVVNGNNKITDIYVGAPADNGNNGNSQDSDGNGNQQ